MTHNVSQLSKQDIVRAINTLDSLYPTRGFLINETLDGYSITFAPSPYEEWITVEIERSVFNFVQDEVDPFVAVVEQYLDYRD